MRKTINIIIILLTLVGFAECTSQTDNIVQEDYSKLFTLKPAEKVKQEPGVPFACFPSQIGEIGFEYNPEDYQSPGQDSYEIEFLVEAYTDIYSKVDPQNLSKLTFQYLDENNKLVIKELLDGSNNITVKENSWGPSYNGAEIYETYTLEKKSGTPFYFAVFYSPYGYFYLNIEARAKLKDGTVELPTVSHSYDARMESFHITERGVEYIINSKATILP